MIPKSGEAPDLKLASSCAAWTIEEDTRLASSYRMSSHKGLVTMFPGRTWEAIHQRAKKLRVWRYKTRDVPKLTEQAAMVAAWALACEGTICLVKSRHDQHTYFMPKLLLFNTRPELVQRFTELVGCGAVSCRKPYKTRTRSQNLYLWTLYGVTNILAFLRQIRPFLPIKEDVADLVMEYCESRLRLGNKVPYTVREQLIQQEIVRRNMSRHGNGAKALTEVNDEGPTVRSVGFRVPDRFALLG